MSSKLPIASLLPLLALFACNTDDPNDKTKGLDPDPLVTDTGTTTSTTTTSPPTNTTTNHYLDPESVELPDPALYDYSASVYFSPENIAGGFDGRTAAEDPTILCDQTTCPPNTLDEAPFNDMMAIDNDFGFWVQDFLGAFPEDRDGEYDDGFVGYLVDLNGAPNGVHISSVETQAYQAGYPRGAWCGGLGESLVKCSSEHYVALEHALTCYETVPYMNYDPVTGLALDPIYDQVCYQLEQIPQYDIDNLDVYEDDYVAMASSQDYAVTLKDDGKYLYRWGTWDKRPTDVRLTTTIALPAEWKGSDVYRVTRAELAVVHTITNSPNDQIRPEDLENESATGRLPSYTEQVDGSWTSNVDCWESDGHFIPAGTVLKNPGFAVPTAGSPDLIQGLTNAWYTTLDRDPFETDPATGSGPRWRLKAPKFGQDIPGVEISTVNCAEPPVQKDFIKYDRGELTATIIDLLDWDDSEDSPLLYSTGWTQPNIQDMSTVDPDVTINGVRLTDDLDLSVYIKGESKATNLYKAVLYVDYELVTP